MHYEQAAIDSNAVIILQPLHGSGFSIDEVSVFGNPVLAENALMNWWRKEYDGPEDLRFDVKWETGSDNVLHVRAVKDGELYTSRSYAQVRYSVKLKNRL